jgi:hypothetical protein
MVRNRGEQERENPYGKRKGSKEEVEEENAEKEEVRGDVAEVRGEQEGMAGDSVMRVQKVSVLDITLNNSGTLQFPTY